MGVRDRPELVAVSGDGTKCTGIGWYKTDMRRWEGFCIDFYFSFGVVLYGG